MRKPKDMRGHAQLRTAINEIASRKTSEIDEDKKQQILKAALKYIDEATDEHISLNPEFIGRFIKSISDSAPDKWVIKNVPKYAEYIWAKFTGDTKTVAKLDATYLKPYGDHDWHYYKTFLLTIQRFAKHQFASGSITEYKHHRNLDDFDKPLPEKTRIGIIADWGTGETEAIDLLKEVIDYKPKPEILIHLGDIYYSGSCEEVDEHFRQPWKDYLVPEKIRAFTLSGNHDMYSGGDAYYGLIKDLDQPASYFCLQNKHWQILAIDTGRNSIFYPIEPNIGDHELEWVKDKINNRGNRKTILLSHHQLISADWSFEKKKNYNTRLFDQFKDVLGSIDLWLWGHEHNLVIFKKDYEIERGYKLKRGRCVGGSAYPVEQNAIDRRKRKQDMIEDIQFELDISGYFYQHCYAIIDLIGAKAIVNYYEDGKPNMPLWRDKIQ